MKSDHPNVLLCPDTPQFPIESKEAEIHTKKLKYLHHAFFTKEVTYLSINTFFRDMARKLQSQDDEEKDIDDGETKDEIDDEEDEENDDEERDNEDEDEETDEETDKEDEGEGEETDAEEGK